MVTFLESLAGQIQDRWCALSTDDIILGGLVAAGSGVGLPALGIAGVAGVLRKSSDQICNKSAPTPNYSLPESDFSGGQCEKPYYINVNFDYRDFTGVLQQNQSVNFGVTGLMGPISSVKPRIVPLDANRQVLFFDVAYNGGVLNEQITQSLGNPNADFSLNSITPVPLSGGDTCGDPPAPPPAPISEYDDVIDDVPFEDDDGNPINFPDVPVKWFPPCIGLDGIKVPFEIETPLGNICGQLQAKPDIKSGIKPKVDFDLCPSARQTLEPAIPEKMKDYFELSDDYGNISNPFPSSDYGGVPALQADNEKPILGIFIECGTDGSEDGKATKIFNNDDSSDAPTLFVPRIGYVRFWMLAEREGSDAVQWSLPIDIKQPRAFIPCPSPFGALAVDVQMLEGYSARYKVAKRKTCCEACEKFDPNAPNDALDRCD